jgi:hypothetical protein
VTQKIALKDKKNLEIKKNEKLKFINLGSANENNLKIILLQ